MMMLLFEQPEPLLAASTYSTGCFRNATYTP